VPAISSRRLAPALAASIALLAIAAPDARATTGAEAPAPAPEPAPLTPAPTGTILLDGSAAAPPGAPPAVLRAFAAANRIHLLPYEWGGGHRRFRDNGYDCSGAVSYVLHAAGMLRSPLVSGSLAARWGAPGPGQWITVYAHRTHTYAVIAGLRWDTSSAGELVNSGSGPRWRQTQRSAAGFRVRHYPGY